MRVLIACEFSGRVRDAFIRKGHQAVSCDLLDTELPGPHYTGNVKDLLVKDWDLLICHPPCTYLAVSQAWTFWHPEDKGRICRRPHPDFPDRLKQKHEAIEFCKQLFYANIEKICLENPIGFLSTEWRKPNQIIHPWQFGHEESKKTCLWLKNLPRLHPTCIMENRSNNCTPSGQNKLPPTPDRWKHRSRTYEGIAAAMANQWG